MSFAASEFHGSYQLKPCALRVYLHAKGIKAADPDAYYQLLVKLGERHEQRHLSQLGNYFHAHGNVGETQKAFTQKENVIYQPEMKASHPTYGDIVGRPDFFIREDDGYLIRDCKLSRRFTEDDHSEIFRQLELYGWLFEQTFGKPALRLEAYMGDGQIQTVPYQPDRALEVLVFIQGIKQRTEEPFEAIGWSKCLDCGYNDYCWGRAKATHAVGMLPGIDQALALAFHEQNLICYDELLSKYDEASLAEMQKEVGKKLQKVGGAARKILNHAKAFQSGEMIRLKISRREESAEPSDVRCGRNTPAPGLFRKNISVGTKGIRRETASLFAGGGERDGQRKIVTVGKNFWASARQSLRPTARSSLFTGVRTKRRSSTSMLKNAATARAWQAECSKICTISSQSLRMRS